MKRRKTKMYEIKIKNMKKREHKSIKATFSVILNDVVEINNCKLIYSEKNGRYYVFFPSFSYKEKNYSYVRFSSSLHQEVLEKATEEYSIIG